MAPPLHCSVVKRPQQYFILTHITAEQIFLLKKFSLKAEKKQRRAVFLKYFCVLWCFQLPLSPSIHSRWQPGYISWFWKRWQKPGEGLVKGVAWIYTDKRKADLIIYCLVFSECFLAHPSPSSFPTTLQSGAANCVQMPDTSVQGQGISIYKLMCSQRRL